MGAVASKCFGSEKASKLGPATFQPVKRDSSVGVDVCSTSTIRTEHALEPRQPSVRHPTSASLSPPTGNPVTRLCQETEHGLAVLDRETLVSELHCFSQPVAVLYVLSVTPAARGAYETTHSSLDRPGQDDDLGLAVRRNSFNGEACLLFTTEQGSTAVGCVFANTAAVRALQLQDEEQDMLNFLARSFAKDPGLKVLFQDIVKRLLQGQLTTVNHFVPGDFGRDRYFLSMRISPFAYRLGATGGAAGGGDPHSASPLSTQPELPAASDASPDQDDGGRGSVTPAMILELDVPYQGKELAARLQRDYMIISHIPSIVTMFDKATGRVLHQNRSSVAYMGHLVGLDEDWSAAPSRVDAVANVQTGQAALDVAGPAEAASAIAASKRAASSGLAATADAGARVAAPPNRLHQLFSHDPAKLQEVLRAMAEGMEWRGLVKMPPKAQWTTPPVGDPASTTAGAVATEGPTAATGPLPPIPNGAVYDSMGASSLLPSPGTSPPPGEPRRIAADLLRELQATVLTPAVGSGARARSSAFGKLQPVPRSAMDAQLQQSKAEAKGGIESKASGDAASLLAENQCSDPLPMRSCAPLSGCAAGSAASCLFGVSSLQGAPAAPVAPLTLSPVWKATADRPDGKETTASAPTTDGSSAACQVSSTPAAAAATISKAAGPHSGRGLPWLQVALAAAGAPCEGLATVPPNSRPASPSLAPEVQLSADAVGVGGSVTRNRGRTPLTPAQELPAGLAAPALPVPDAPSGAAPVWRQPPQGAFGSPGAARAAVAAASLAAWGSHAAPQPDSADQQKGTGSAGRDGGGGKEGAVSLNVSASCAFTAGYGNREGGDEQISGSWVRRAEAGDAGDAGDTSKDTLLLMEGRGSASDHLSDLTAANLSIEFMPHHLRPGSVLMWGRGSSSLGRGNTFGPTAAQQPVKALAYIDEECDGSEGAEELSFLLPKVGQLAGTGVAAAAAARLPRAQPPRPRGRPTGEAPPEMLVPICAGLDSDNVSLTIVSPNSCSTGPSPADGRRPSLPLGGGAAQGGYASQSSSGADTPVTPGAVSCPGGAAVPGYGSCSLPGQGQDAETLGRVSAPQVLPHGRPPVCMRSRSSGLPAEAGAAAAGVTAGGAGGGGGAARGGLAAPDRRLPHAHSTPSSRTTTYLQHTSQEHGRRLHTVLRALVNSGAQVTSSASNALLARSGTGSNPNMSDGMLRHVRSLAGGGSSSSAAMPSVSGPGGGGAGGGGGLRASEAPSGRPAGQSVLALSGDPRAAPREPEVLRARSGALSEAEEECRWHEVHVKPCFDPMSSQPLVMVIQTDVTSKVCAELQLARVLEAEHRLLADIFPRHVVHYMTQRRKDLAELERNGLMMLRHIQDPAALATSHESITVLFADIKGFTEMSKEVPPAVVMTFLNDLYTRFDSLTDVYGVYKVETIGDCYMVAGGLVSRDGDGYGRAVRGQGDVDPLAPQRVVAFARAMLEEAGKVALPNTGEPVQVRVGVHSGPVVSGVVGQKMPRFCLFGDTINTASRMESTGRPGAVHISAATRSLLPPEEDEQGWAPTGGVEVKGKGRMETYLWCPQTADAGRHRRDKQRQAMLLGTLSTLLPTSTSVSPPASGWGRRAAGPPSNSTAAGTARPSVTSSSAFDATSTML